MKFDLFSNLFNNGLSESNEVFDKKAYDDFNEKKIEEFCSKYDLSTVIGIMQIPVSESKRYNDGGKSVVYMPEQILNRKATKYKKEKQYDLAIACLKKANELYEYSFYSYTRDDYERLVNVMIDAGLYEDAKKVHKKLDVTIGSYVDMLYKLKDVSCKTQQERKKYQETIIDKRIKEEIDREKFYFLRENYHDIAPKSFVGYRRMKNSKSKNYMKIIDCLKKDGIEITDIRFWIK